MIELYAHPVSARKREIRHATHFHAYRRAVVTNKFDRPP